MFEDNTSSKKNEGQAFEQEWPPWFDNSDLSEISFEDIDKDITDEIINQAFDILAKYYKNYNVRQDQISMSKNILHHFLIDKSSIIEAGTGIGKSFAYLIASIAFSYLSGERVFITTETKNLQLQLFEKDMAILQELLDQNISYDLCLGSDNYLCLLNYRYSFDKGTFLDVLKKDQIPYMHSFVDDINSRKKQGHFYELDINVSYEFWRQISRDSEGCPGNRCDLYETCNYYRVKNKWYGKRLLIGNHHLLLYHFLNNKSILPEYGALILDEAHGFLKTSYSIFTLTYSRENFDDRKKTFESMMKKAVDFPPEMVEEYKIQWDDLKIKWDSFFSHWEVELDMNFEETSSKIISDQMNLNPPLHGTSEIVSTTKSLSDMLIKSIDAEEDSAVLNHLMNADKFLQRTIKFFDYFKSFDFNKFVYWGDKRRDVFYLSTCNLLIKEELAESLTEPQAWTSATLGYWPYPKLPTTKQELLNRGYFDSFINTAIPIEESKENSTNKKNLKVKNDLSHAYSTNVYFSPFNYSKHAVLYIPQNLDTPIYNAPDNIKDEYEEKLLEEIIRLIELSNGGALILFTSHYMLRKFSSLIQELVDNTIYSQSEYGAVEALEHFREDSHSVLLGTTSYWQGVDVTGFGLRMLIITKLMFTPPDDPIFKARSIIVEKEGGNSFYNLSLPQASTMLRQAFGRLIRNENDTGIVSILDSRILKKSYGKLLLANLPPVALAKNFEQLESLTKKNKLMEKVK